MIRVRSWMLPMMSLVIASSITVMAEEPTPPMPSPLGEKDLVAPTAEEAQVAERLIASLAEASQRLGENPADTKTLELQTAAIADIDELLTRLRAGARPNPTPQPQTPSAGSQSSSSASTSQQSRRNENRDAAQSSEQATQGDEVGGETEVTHRLNLAQSVWGHLPAKQQEELKRAFSERFLPQYEESIRRYYEALAEEAAARERAAKP